SFCRPCRAASKICIYYQCTSSLDDHGFVSHIALYARPIGLRTLPGSNASGLPNNIASSGGCDMRQYDLTPLYRSTIGFDRLGSLLDTLGSFDGEGPSYPPYNIE